MVGRFEWERALRDAQDVPWHVKSLLLLVGTYMSADGRDARPTVPTLARTTGLSRSRVFALLREAETAGWMHSKATPGKASVRVPTIPNPSYPQDPSCPQDPLTRPAHRTRGSYPQDGRGPAHRTHTKQDHASTTQPRARETFDAAVDHVLAEFERIDGRRRYDRREVIDVVSGFLRGKQVSKPLGYVRKSFDANPEQFRPTSLPPHYRRETA